MSDPRRLSESDGAGGPLLQAARRARPPARAKERVYLAASSVLGVSGSTAGAAAAGAAAGEGAVAGVAKTGALLGAKWIGIVGLTSMGAVVGTATVVATHRLPPHVALAPTVSAPLPAVEATWPEVSTLQGSVATAAVPSSPEIPATAPTAVRTASPTPTAGVVAAPSAAAGAPGTSALPAELAFLDDARRTLRSGDPARALSILDRYAERFPAGAMAPEATMLRIEALVKAGDRPAALRFAHAFLQGDPSSPYGLRVRSLLGGANP